MKRLERIILEQQKRIGEQERRLEEQRRKISAQERRLRKVERQSRRAAAARKRERTTTITWLGPEELSMLRGGRATPRGLQVQLPDGRTYTVPYAKVIPARFLAEEQPRPPVEVPPKRPERPKAPAPRAPERPKAPEPGGSERPKAPEPRGSERPKSEKPVEQLLVERGAILLRPGMLQLESGLEYARFSGSRVAISGLTIFEAIIIGTLRVDSLERDIITGSLRARYGVHERAQVDFLIPYVYRRDNEVLGVGTGNVRDRAIDGNGIGDIELGVTVQPLIGGGAIPDVLVRLNGVIPTGEHPFEIPTVVLEGTTEQRLTRTPTGSGFYAVGGTVTAVWTSDPVAFFAGGGYQINLPRNFEGQGRIDPGDTLQFFAGLNLAVNERVSLNLSFISQRTRSTLQNGRRAPGSSFTDSRLTLGTSIALGRRTSLILGASVGLGEQSPDFVFSIRLPITFELFKP